MESKQIHRFVQRRINQNRKKRPIRRYTDEQMFAALKKVGGGQRISENEYTRKRSDEDPTAMNFYHRFGSFKIVAEMVFGKPPVKMTIPNDIDEEYVIKLLNQFGITSKEQYREKAKAEPEIFPSEYSIFKMFKNYGNLFEAAKRWNIDQQLILCLKVKRCLGKSPSLEEYAKGGVNTGLLIRKYITLKNLNRFVRLLEEAYAVSRRNQGKIETDDKKAIEREEKEVFKPFSEQLRP